MDWVLRNAFVYDCFGWRTDLRLEERGARLERKIKRAILVVLLALAGSFLYSVVNALLVIKPFIFQSSRYQSLQESGALEFTILSVPLVTTKAQNDELEKIIERKAASVVVALEVSEQSTLIQKLQKKYSNVISSPDGDSKKVIIASNFKNLSYKHLGIDIPPGLIVEIEQPNLQIAACNPNEISDKKSNSQAKMALRRIATAMRHSHQNWIVVCRVGGSIFSTLYQKFIEATNGASNQLETPSKFGISNLVVLGADAKQKRPLQVFFKGNVAVKLLDQIPIVDSQPALFSSFLTSSQALSSSSSE